MMKEIEQLEFM